MTFNNEVSRYIILYNFYYFNADVVENITEDFNSLVDVYEDDEY